MGAQPAGGSDEDVSFDGRLADDAAALEAAMEAAEIDLAALPAKPLRNAAQQQAADVILLGMRRIRQRFLARHTDEVYAALIARHRHRLNELVGLAAERFAGLVPGVAQMQREQAHIQSEKEGREIDQGLFVRAILRSASAGRHLIETMLQPTPRAKEALRAFQHDGRVDLASVQLERSGAAALMTLQGARNLNAENVQLVEDMETAVDVALLDPAISVGVIRGGVMAHPKYAGRRVFCSGINLRELHDGKIPLLDFLLTREMGLLNKLRCGLRGVPEAGGFDDGVQKPWIAVVDSFAIGGGMQLLLAMDYVIAARDAFFSLPAANEGIVPGAANLRIGRLAGSRLARRIILGGRQIKATDPDAHLFCDSIAAPEDIEAALSTAIAQMAAPAVAANRKMLALAEETPDAFREYMAEFAVVQAIRSYSPDVIAKLKSRWAAAPA